MTTTVFARGRRRLHWRRRRLAGELEEALVVRPRERRTERVMAAQVRVVLLGLGGRVPALLADVGLGSALLVGKAEFESVDLPAVGLERASLRERLVAVLATVRADT